VGAEALLRIVDGERRLVTPDHFLLVAQETGLLPLMAQRLRSFAFADLARWRSDPSCVGVERLAFNLTARELANPEFVSQLAASMAAVGVKGSDLSIEVTEHVLMQTSHSAVASLTGLRDIGIHVGHRGDGLHPRRWRLRHGDLHVHRHRSLRHGQCTGDSHSAGRPHGEAGLDDSARGLRPGDNHPARTGRDGSVQLRPGEQPCASNIRGQGDHEYRPAASPTRWAHGRAAGSTSCTR
jgi:EAL domain